MAYSILLLDDHKIITNGLKIQLENNFPGASVYEANTTTEAYDALHRIPIDIVISDLSVDDYLSELELVNRIKEINPKTILIVFSMHAHASIIQSLIDKGISGYVVKTSDSKEINTSINIALKGGTHLCQTAKKVLEDSQTSKPSTYIFTQREKQIIKLIVDGKKTGQIARQLKITVNTVESHRKNIYQKTGTKNMAELVKIALTQGIVES
jgi:DNA-binding NarL/FixJ family response regulator